MDRLPTSNDPDLATWLATRVAELEADPREEVRRIAERLRACMSCETSSRPGRCTDCMISAFRGDEESSAGRR